MNQKARTRTASGRSTAVSRSMQEDSPTRSTKVASSGRTAVHLLVGDVKPTMLRANPDEMAKAKAFLGYKSNQEMVIDLIQNAVDEKAFREQRVKEQRGALALLDDLDLTDLAEVTRFEPVDQVE